jgi:predicted nucleic acid-binding protein
LALSLQVLQEFYAQATRTSRNEFLDHADAVQFMRALRRYKIQDLTLALFDIALEIKRRYGFSYWDCAIIAAAKELRCHLIYTEDLQHNQIVEGIRIVNPFVD